MSRRCPGVCTAYKGARGIFSLAHFIITASRHWRRIICSRHNCSGGKEDRDRAAAFRRLLGLLCALATDICTPRLVLLGCLLMNGRKYCLKCRVADVVQSTSFLVALSPGPVRPSRVAFHHPQARPLPKSLAWVPFQDFGQAHILAATVTLGSMQNVLKLHVCGHLTDCHLEGKMRTAVARHNISCPLRALKFLRLQVLAASSACHEGHVTSMCQT